jgi:nucleotidyltransferase substrate binding protein (TIGR01987 family)
MSEAKIQQSLRNLGNALERLKEALAQPEENSLHVDGTIQRFEFVIELYWKTFKRLLAFEGIETNTPREALQGAYQARWIDNDQAWLQMLKDRNETSHVYDEGTAQRIYTNIKANYSELQDTYLLLIKRYGEMIKDPSDNV